MAITEEDKERLAKEDAQRKITAYEEAIAKAEKYERLKDNPDWQAYLEDLKIEATFYDRNIGWAREMLVDAPYDGYLKMGDNGKQEYVSSKMDWMDYIQRNDIERVKCLKLVRDPANIMKMAAMARERLPAVKEKVMELTHVSGLASENGKS
jgi:hypothetical protein